MVKRIPIAEAKRVAEAQGLKQVLLLGWDGEQTHIVTYGVTKKDCEEVAIAQKFWQGDYSALMGGAEASLRNKFAQRVDDLYDAEVVNSVAEAVLVALDEFAK